jgi:hypothetical protein
MGQLLTIFLVSAIGLLATGIGLNWAQRELTRKKKDHRMGQALRRGLGNPAVARTRMAPVVKWQECESTSARLS